jgi:signal peptidase II
MVKKKILITSLIVLAIDQIVKYFARMKLEEIPVIQNFFHLTLVENTGAGFGLLQGQRFLLIAISLIVLGFIIYYCKEIRPRQEVPIGLILGGLASNLIDRVFLGYVVDFLDFRIWPVFNLGDSALCVGVVWLFVIYFLDRNNKG